MHKLVFVRHGDATRHLENHFLGVKVGGRNLPRGNALVLGLDDGLRPVRVYDQCPAQTSRKVAWRLRRKATPDFLRLAGNTAGAAESKHFISTRSQALETPWVKN